MDYIPRPRGSNTPQVDVPLLIDLPYLETPPGTMKNYLNPSATNCDITSTGKEIATFMQARLYFGLLGEYLRDTPKLLDYTVSTDGNEGYRRRISLEKLANSSFGEDERMDLTEEEAEKGIGAGKVERFVVLLQDLALVMKYLESLPHAWEYPAPQVALSVRVLADALMTLLLNEKGRNEYIKAAFQSKRNYRHCYPRKHASNSSYWEVSPSLQIIYDRFKANGWCLSRVHALSKSFSYMTLYYMSQIQRRHPADLNHGDCEGSVCTAAAKAAALNEADLNKPQHIRVRDRYQEMVSARTPRPLHFEEGKSALGISPKETGTAKKCMGDCELHEIQIHKVIELLEEGRIPLVKITETKAGQLVFDIVPATMNSRYIAISHVLSDGLGNKDGNAIYDCQLRNILDGLARLPTNTGEVMSSLAFNRLPTCFPWSIPGIFTRNEPYKLFWLDILCIPSKPNCTALGKNGDAIRSNAIGQISATFSGATQVLVLDGEVQTLRRDMCEMPEILTHFTGCNWAARAWTYAEGAESLKAHVKLADGFFDPRDYELDARDWSGFTRRDPKSVRKLLQTSLEDVFSETTFTYAIERCISRTIQDFIHQSWFTKIERQTDVNDPPIKRVWNSLRQTFRITRPPVKIFDTFKRFVKVWNELLQRDCTKADDLLYIFAMTLEIPMYEIISTGNARQDLMTDQERIRAKEEKVKAMIWSLPEVPLGLLFNPCREDRIKDHHYDDDLWARRLLGSRDLYPLRPNINVRGNFSDEKDMITFRFPGLFEDRRGPTRAGEGSENILVIAIPDLPGQFPWIRLTINGRVSIIRVHSPAPTATGARTILILDKLTFASEDGYPGKWAAGCCLYVQGVRSTSPGSPGSSSEEGRWKFHTKYGSSVSAMWHNDARNELLISGILENLPVGSVGLVDINNLENVALGPTGELTDAVDVSLSCTCPDTIFSPVDRRELLNPYSMLAIEDPVSKIPVYVHYALFMASQVLYWVSVMQTLDNPEGVKEAWVGSIIGFVSIFPAITASMLGREFSRLVITGFLYVYIKRGVMKPVRNPFKTVWKNSQLVTTGDTFQFLGLIWVSLLGPIIQLLYYRETVKKFRDFNDTDNAYMTVTVMNIAMFPLTALASFAWPVLSRTLWLISFSKDMATSERAKPNQTRELWQRVALGELVATAKFLWNFHQIKADSKVPFE